MMRDLERLAAWFISQSARHDCPHDMVAQFAEECGLREPPVGVAVKAVESLVIDEDVKGLLISVPGDISEQGIHRLQQDWEEAFEGTRAGEMPTVVLCDGVSVSTVSEPVGTYAVRPPTPEWLDAYRSAFIDEVFGEREGVTEKDRRVYYQSRLYEVATWIDKRVAGTTVTGTADNPENNLLARLNAITEARCDVCGQPDCQAAQDAPQASQAASGDTTHPE